MVRLLIIGAGLVVASAVFAIAGCSDQYRYPCQDPMNWEKEECKPPICTATGTCPDQLIKPEQEKK